MKNGTWVIEKDQWHWFLAGSATVFILTVLCCLWHR